MGDLNLLPFNPQQSREEATGTVEYYYPAATVRSGGARRRRGTTSTSAPEVQPNSAARHEDEGFKSVPRSEVQVPSVPRSEVQVPSVPRSEVQVPSVPRSEAQVPSVPRSEAQVPSAAVVEWDEDPQRYLTTLFDKILEDLRTRVNAPFVATETVKSHHSSGPYKKIIKLTNSLKVLFHKIIEMFSPST